MRQEFVTFVTSEEASEHSPGVYAMRPARRLLWPVMGSNWPGRGHIVSYSCLLRITPSFSEELLQSPTPESS